MVLSDRQVKQLKAKDKDFKLSDEKGMYLLMKKSGSKYWRLKYRFHGKEKMLALGVYPDVSLKAARKKRDAAREKLADGIDPAVHKKAQKEAELNKLSNTFEAIAREWHEKKKHIWTERHAHYTLNRLELYLFPRFGNKPITDISAKEILDALRRIESKGALHTAHRALSSCSQVFRYAVATDKVNSDPCKDLRGALPPEKVKHRAAITDPNKVGQLMRTINAYEGSIVVKCALKLAPLVFVRPGELRTARWDDIDFEKAEWQFVVTKTNTRHVVPLAKQSINILKEIKPYTGNGEYVFPSHRSPKRPMSDNAVLVALRTMGISKEEMSGHGFRAMARTILDEILGFRPDYIEHQLAHAVRDPNGRAYNRTSHLKERKKMMQVWADYLDDLEKDKIVIEGDFNRKQ
ncbi:MAG: tyrosine-type recombinase/integrase [Gammaproteobacteria bacterium]|jgi:integrase